MFRSSSIASTNAAGSSAAAVDRRRPPRRPAATKPSIRRYAGRRLAQRLLGVVDHRAVVRGGQVVAQLDRPDAERLDRWQVDHVADRLAHLGAAQVEQRRGAPRTGRTAARPPATGRSRSRGAGRPGRARRRGCRTRRRGSASTWPSTRCASPAGRAPTARATAPRPARRPWRPSTGRSRAGRAWPGPARPSAGCMLSGRCPDSCAVLGEATGTSK